MMGDRRSDLPVTATARRLERLRPDLGYGSLREFLRRTSAMGAFASSCGH
jgi:hypothetical protein